MPRSKDLLYIFPLEGLEKESGQNIFDYKTLYIFYSNFTSILPNLLSEVTKQIKAKFAHPFHYFHRSDHFYAKQKVSK